MTRRVALYMATSLDGYIAGPGGDLSWRFDDADHARAAFYARADLLLMGRRTYETALSCATWPYAGRKVVVFSRRGDLVVASPDTVATAREPGHVIAELRAREGASIWVVGGGEIAQACLDADAVDDVILAVHPLLLGCGTRFAASTARRTPLALVAERRFPSGLIQLAYRVQRAG